MLRELHVTTARAYGNGLVDCLYRGTSGASDPVAMARMEAAHKMWEWIYSTNGDVLPEVVGMMEAKTIARAAQDKVSSLMSGASDGGDGGMVMNPKEKPTG